MNVVFNCSALLLSTPAVTHFVVILFAECFDDTALHTVFLQLESGRYLHYVFANAIFPFVFIGMIAVSIIAVGSLALCKRSKRRTRSPDVVVLVTSHTSRDTEMNRLQVEWTKLQQILTECELDD